MGMFDTLLLTCPHCGGTTHEQSKAGECIMKYYTLDEAPLAIIGDVGNKPLICDHCAKSFVLEVNFETQITSLDGDADAKQALALLEKLNHELNTLHLDIDGDHRYALSARANPIITRIKHFLSHAHTGVK